MADTQPNGITIAELTKVPTLVATDLFELDRYGTGVAVSYETLLSSISDALGLTGVREMLEQIIG